MLLSKFVLTGFSGSTRTYYKNFGYDTNIRNARVKVSVNHLHPGSNANVCCRCENCNKKYIQRFCRPHQVCGKCRTAISNIGNKHGTKNKGKPLPSMSGELHPRWNANKSEFKKYVYQVRRITEQIYADNVFKINPQNYPRTLCGVEGGHQLDHIISVYEGFNKKIPPEIIGGIENLRLLTWEENRSKWHKS